MDPERCEQCRFDGRHYSDDDALGTLRSLGPRWRHMTEGISAEVLQARPAPGVWSAVEYAAHTGDVLRVMSWISHQILTTDGFVIPEPPPGDQPVDPEPALLDPATVVDELHQTAMRFHDKVADKKREWKRTARIGADQPDVGWIVRHAAHDATHHLQDVGRGLHALGAGAPTTSGSVVQLNVSGGGVPKLPVPEVVVDARGIEGDRQAARKHHGRPFQALSLWSAEVIDELKSEGHPIDCGSAGENITVAGIDWSTIRPGVRLRVGEVLAEISAYAVPCKKNAHWFLGGDFNRMQHERHPGTSRAYASVVEDGVIRTGDAVVVEP
jgi:MOSC domain-containing protein YiiM